MKRLFTIASVAAVIVLALLLWDIIPRPHKLAAAPAIQQVQFATDDQGETITYPLGTIFHARRGDIVKWTAPTPFGVSFGISPCERIRYSSALADDGSQTVSCPIRQDAAYGRYKYSVGIVHPSGRVLIDDPEGEVDP